MPMPVITPLPLERAAEPFDHPEWLFEAKYDGFRTLAYVSRGVVKLISRKGIVYKAFADLCSAIADATRCRSAILDGEIICCDEDGRPLFNDLLRRQKPARYVAFDLLWLNGVDWRERSLVLRRQELRAVIPAAMSRIWMGHTVAKQGKAVCRSVPTGP